MEDYVPFDTFKKLDLRIGKIVSVKRIEGADKLYKLEIDIGEPKPRISVAGMAAYKLPSDLEGQLVPVITNLQPVTLRGVKSEAMILCADVGGKPYILNPESDVPPGTKIR